MPVTDVEHDPDGPSLTIVADFAAPVSRVWELYTDARQLEKVFGPPGHPATFVEHAVEPGGVSKYFMTGEDGERYHGMWNVINADEGILISFEDFFTDENFEPLEGMPVSQNTYTFAENEDGTRAAYVTTFESADALQQVLDMGGVEGATAAIDQIDGFLTEHP